MPHRRTTSRWALALMVAGLCAPAPAAATWSIVVVDARTGRIVVSSATCVSQTSIKRFPAKGLRDLQAIVVPGVGAAVAQAGLDRSGRNQSLIYRELRKGTAPEQILEMLDKDPGIDNRQFGFVDRKGRTLAFSGLANVQVAAARTGRIRGTDVYYAVQGNILASRAVVDDAVRALALTDGTLEDRVMAAMEAADRAGGDRRCSCRTRPFVAAPCTTRHAQVAYLLASDPTDAEGRTFSDGAYRMVIEVTDENIRAHEDANPVRTLRMRYDAAVRTEGDGG